MAKAKPPGFKDGFPVPGKELHPHERNPADLYGEARQVLKYAQPNQMIGDFGAPDAWPSQSPSSARHTPGRPMTKPAQKDDEDATLQPGIRRP